MKIKFKKLNKDAKDPRYAHPGDVGLDLYSLEQKVMMPSEQYIFMLGFALEFPEGNGGFIMDKSSISKEGLVTKGGVYDAGYRGEYNVQLVNLSDKPYTIEKGDKIAQLVILPIVIGVVEEFEELSDSSRGEGRFGSTGKK